MVGSPGAAAAGLWFAAHQAHGALVGQWARSAVDLVVAVGPIHTVEERAALVAYLPETVFAEYVVIDAPVALTLVRALADPSRGMSCVPEFHYAAHARFRAFVPDMPRHLLLVTSTADDEAAAQAIEITLDCDRGMQIDSPVTAGVPGHRRPTGTAARSRWDADRAARLHVKPCQDQAWLILSSAATGSTSRTTTRPGRRCSNVSAEQ